ncbi:MAG: PTS sugar transporter subunit IIA [Erysipelotrichaceae bacterium]
MIKILVVSHGEMAKGILNSAQMIIGKFDNVDYLVFNEKMGISELEEEMNKKITNISDEMQYLIFTDILGGSPFNTACRFSFENENVSIIYGMNLPLLMQAIISKEGNSLEGLVKNIVDSIPESSGLCEI